MVGLAASLLGLGACGAERSPLDPDPRPTVVTTTTTPTSLAPGEAFTATVTATPPARARLAWVTIRVTGLVTAGDSVPVDTDGPITITRVYQVPRTAGNGSVAVEASGGTPGGQPGAGQATVAVVDVGAPSVAPSTAADTLLQPGDSLRVAFSASDGSALRYSVLRVTGALTVTDSVDHAGAPRADHSLWLKAPAAARLGTVAQVTAEAVDYAGNRTITALPAIRYADVTAPGVSLQAAGGRNGRTFGRGEVLTLALTASDQHRLAWVGYRFAESVMGADSAMVAGASTVQTLRVSMPPVWVGTSGYTVFATDSSGNRREVTGAPITVGVPAGSDVPLCVRETTVLTAGAGTTPEFRWTPDCAVTSVAVMAVGAPTIRWTIRAPEATIRSPVRFGVVPPGGTLNGSGTPLEPGITYRVLLGLRTSATTERTVTSTTFVP